MPCRSVVLHEKRELFNSLQRGDLDAAKTMFLTSKRSAFIGDACFHAISANQPEFIQFVFEHFTCFEGCSLPDVLKQVQFATMPSHYKAIAELAKDKHYHNGNFKHDIFYVALMDDNAHLINWLFDNNYLPLTNYVEDETDTWTLLDIAGDLNKHKCVITLIERGIECTSFTKLGDNAWAYPWPENTLNTASIWEWMIRSSVIKKEKHIGEWIDLMAKSASNCEKALLSLFSLCCERLAPQEYLLSLLQESKKLTDYLSALDEKSLTKLNKTETLLALFFNQPEVVAEEDILHLLSCISDTDNGINLDLCHTPAFCQNMPSKDHIITYIESLKSSPLVTLTPTINSFYAHLANNDSIDDLDFELLDADTPIYFNTSIESTYCENDGSEEHF